jgi:hypothetical protein
MSIPIGGWWIICFSLRLFHKNNLCLVFTAGGFLRNLHEMYQPSYVGSFDSKNQLRIPV